MKVQLREIAAADLNIFFAQQREPAAVQMAAFTARDPDDRIAFVEHWARILQNDSNWNRTVECDGEVAGHVANFLMEGQREVTYWLGQKFWGRGIATQAMMLMLQAVDERPLYARAAKDNLGSVRVLEKCGFRIVGEEKGFANARGAEIAELVLRLDAPPG